MLTQDASGDVALEPAPSTPRLMTGSELYAAFFDVAETHPPELRERLRMYARLANDPSRTDRDDDQLQVLHRQLTRDGVDVGFGPVPRNGNRSS